MIDLLYISGGLAVLGFILTCFIKGHIQNLWRRPWFWLTHYECQQCHFIVPSSDGCLGTCQHCWDAAGKKVRDEAREEKVALIVAALKQFSQSSQYETLYHELLYSVARVFPGESRHETALRYIQEAENQKHGPSKEL